MAWSSRVSSRTRVSPWPANHHGQPIVSIGGSCDAANGMLHSDDDFAVTRSAILGRVRGITAEFFLTTFFLGCRTLREHNL